MSRLTRSARLLQNAEAAILSAIEIYNKPVFSYREETFAILALNAWELLVKAKLVSINGNDPRCLYVYTYPKTKSGKASLKRQVKRNRSGNIMTLGLEFCLSEIEKNGVVVPSAVRKNLEALVEIRDNAIHYINAGPQLAKQVLEIGTASLRNFIELGKVWMKLDLSDYNLFLMPIGFIPSTSSMSGLTVSSDERNVVKYLATLMKDSSDEPNQDFHVSLDVNVTFKRTSTADATAVIISNDPGALPITISEEDMRQRYPWGYEDLTNCLTARYSDFKANAKYHQIRKKLMAEPQFKRTRYLDPGNPKGAKKDFYSPNIVAQFDKAYAVKA